MEALICSDASLASLVDRKLVEVYKSVSVSVSCALAVAVAVAVAAAAAAAAAAVGMASASVVALAVAAKGKLATQLRQHQRGWVKGRNGCLKSNGQETRITATWDVEPVKACVDAQCPLRTSELQASGGCCRRRRHPMPARTTPPTR